MDFKITHEAIEELSRIVKQDQEVWDIYQQDGLDQAGLMLNLRGAPGDVDGVWEFDYWDELKAQIRELLCTDSEKFVALRKRIKDAETVSVQSIVTWIVVEIHAVIDLPEKILTPFIAIILYGAFKLGVGAWCATLSG